MSGAMAPVPKDHPLMQAWEKFKASEEFANAKRWAVHTEHLDGSLWAMFDAGWHAGAPCKPMSETGWPYNEKIQCAKRIMEAVDTYHARPDDMSRAALRAAILTELDEYADGVTGGAA